MIPNCSDHAANERTFLAWVRTGIAVIAFGFVIEKFNLFLVTLVETSAIEPDRKAHLQRLAGPSIRYEGLAMIVVGIVLLVVAAARYVRTEHRLSDPLPRPSGGVTAEVLLSATLVLIVAGLCAFLAFAR